MNDRFFLYAWENWRRVEINSTYEAHGGPPFTGRGFTCKAYEKKSFPDIQLAYDEGAGGQAYWKNFQAVHLAPGVNFQLNHTGLQITMMTVGTELFNFSIHGLKVADGPPSSLAWDDTIGIPGGMCPPAYCVQPPRMGGFEQHSEDSCPRIKSPPTKLSVPGKSASSPPKWMTLNVTDIIQEYGGLIIYPHADKFGSFNLQGMVGFCEFGTDGCR